MPQRNKRGRISIGFRFLLGLCLSGPCFAETPDALRLPDVPKPLEESPRTRRPKPLLNLGNPYLGPGRIDAGFSAPGGAVWNPSFMAFGTFQSALQSIDAGNETITEWVNRLDLFGNLQLTATERILIGLRPLDEDNRFSGVRFEGDPTGSMNEFNPELHTLFFEGDISQLFPRLDRRGGRITDLGFSVGRQPLTIQDGMLVDDELDMVGVIRNNLLPRSGSNLRYTLTYAWNEVHRDDNREAGDARLLGLFTAFDGPRQTAELDLVYVGDAETNSDGVYGGFASIQRMGRLNLTLRALGSHALDEVSGKVSDGALLFTECSTTLPHSEDLVYLNAFWGIDQFASAARGPERGGPLGRTGILFAAAGLGAYGAPLGNEPDDSIGAALGCQLFLGSMRRQLVLEAGGRTGTESNVHSEGALGARYQQAIGRHVVLQLDAFGAIRDATDDGFGGRVNVRYEF